MKEIGLTRGYVALVDDDDFGRLSSHKWCATPTKAGFYAVRSVRREDGKSRLQGMHRVILDAKKGELVDHVNGNTLDNRKENLRICTYSQNNINRRKERMSTSRFKGVSWDARTKTWKASVTINRKTKWLGRFQTEVEAALAYDAAAKQIHGEFAKVNFDA